jgi:hypothetical protein
MAVAIVQDWVEEETDRSTTNYDAIHERIMQGGPIEGFLVHTAGFTGRGFRIFEVWETREHFDRFVEERFMPILKEVATADSRQPELTVYDLYQLVVTPEAAGAGAAQGEAHTT